LIFFLTYAINTNNIKLLQIVNEYCIDSYINVDYKKYATNIRSSDIYIYLDENGDIDLTGDVEHFLTNAINLSVNDFRILFDYVYLKIINTGNINTAIIISSIKKIILESLACPINIDLYEQLWTSIFATNCPEIEEFYRKLIRHSKLTCDSNIIDVQNKITRNIKFGCALYSDKLVALKIFNESNMSMQKDLREYNNIDSIIDELIPILLFEAFDGQHLCGFEGALNPNQNYKDLVIKCSRDILSYILSNYNEKYYNHVINIISLNIDAITIVDNITIILASNLLILPDEKFTKLLNPSISILSTKCPRIIEHIVNNYYLLLDTVIEQSVIAQLIIYFSGYYYAENNAYQYKRLCEYILFNLMKKIDYSCNYNNLITDKNNNLVQMSCYYNGIDVRHILKSPYYAHMPAVSRKYFLKYDKCELVCDSLIKVTL
jgi:hypothetical protein